MAIRVRCPNPSCGKEHNLAGELAGKTVKCASCGQGFTAPSAVGQRPSASSGPPAAPPRQAAAIESGVEPPHSKDPLIGTKIAHYRIQSLLGEGGMGKVYKAHNTSLDKTCAIKILPQDFAKQDQTNIDRFVREARSAAKVEHTNVLPVQFVGKVGEHYFIEMQYVDGGTLQGVLQQKGKLEVKEAAQIVRDVAAGLQAAHEKGIIHRDIKPTNVMLTTRGHVYVMDFGLAKSAHARSALTVSGTIMGTPLYMSPEQAIGQAVDPRSDIYSLGVMFFQLLTGTPPYTADSPLVILNMHQSAPIPDIAQVAPEVPHHIAEMVRRMMAKNPTERYQSCAEIADELNAFLTVGGPAVIVSEDALKDAPDHRKSVLRQAKRGAPRLAPLPAGSAPPKQRLAVPVVLVLVLLLVLVLGAVVYFIAKGKKEAVVGAQHAAPLQQGTVAPLPAEQPKFPWDDVYVATAATGEKIRHPLSRKTYKETLADGTTVDVPESMVYVPAGEFTMGENESAHKVYLDAYFIGKYEVTNAEWKVFCDFTGFTPLPDHWKDGRIPEGKENHPVVFVSWEDIQKYCEWVSKETRREVRLPTEAQWEKAARGPEGYRYPWGNQWNPENCNFHGLVASKYGLKMNPDGSVPESQWDIFTKSGKSRELEATGGHTMPVGSFAKGTSFYGCYDMAGNVHEWCADWSAGYYYKMKDATRNPQGPSEEEAQEWDYRGKKSKGRVLRGGHWRCDSSGCSSVHRYHWVPFARDVCYLGFRVAVAREARGSGTPAQTASAPGPAPLSAAQPKTSAWDDVYVSTAATGEKIPHPLSRRTVSAALPDGSYVDVPEGMVYVPAGEFTMGEGPSEHQVYLDGYCIGKYEVTNAEWAAFLAFTGYTWARVFWKGGRPPEGKENCPVGGLTWEDAQKYCEWVSSQTGRKVTLPTEAQWEKAAGWDPQKQAKREYPWGNKWDKEYCNNGLLLAKFGFQPNVEGDEWARRCRQWFDSEKGRELLASGGNSTPGGSFAQDKSAYGCYDLAGNVSEWCWDWFMREYYRLNDANRNPKGPTAEEADESTNEGGEKKGKTRVLRGGAWNNHWGFRCADRNHFPPATRYTNLGLRVVTQPEEASKAIEGQGRKEAEGEGAQPGKSAWDDVYIATAATGDKIPHPLSRKTYRQTLADGTTVDVPEGMVYVPEGESLMGLPQSGPLGPRHKVWLDSYCIAKYKVTNAEWKNFVDDTRRAPPVHWRGGKIPDGRENHPVVNVTFRDATDYCEWIVRRRENPAAGGKWREWRVQLPTEAQWEKAAAGPAGLRYPWGNDWDSTLCNNGGLLLTQLGLASGNVSKEELIRRQEEFQEALKAWEQSEKGKEANALGGNTTPVGAFPRDKSGYGCYDMAGVAADWCADWAGDYPTDGKVERNPQGPPRERAWTRNGAPLRVTRGGAWRQILACNCETNARFGIPEDTRRNTQGLRIALVRRPEAGGAGAGPVGKGAGIAAYLQPETQDAKPGTPPSKSPWGDVSVTVDVTGVKQTIPLPDALVRAVESSQGLVVVAGPTGSGKSTTLAALLEHLNATRTCRICTVENPIGIRLTPKRAVVRQLQVGRDAPDVAGGIASALGHGLDVLFVSPGSDLNRAQELFAEMSAAETGHLVIIEMGADSPESVVQQIMSYFPAEQQAVRRRLAGVLRAVSVQVLLRRADGKGRVAAHDLLIPDDETRRAIAEGGAIPASALAKPDCRSLTESIRRLRDTGIVTAGEAERVLAPRK